MSESLTFSVPGKTFLVGEYLALEGGPSFLLSTGPRFELKITQVESAESEMASVPFALQSPAGRYMARHPEYFQNKKIEFRDPHVGLGGLGASSAQFALMYAYREKLNSVDPKSFDWRKMLEEYRACSFDGEGKPPSGADIVSQFTGLVTRFDGREYQAERLEWNFERLGFTLLRTGVKLATHEHLKTAGAIPNAELREAVEMATRAFGEKSETAMIEAVRHAASTLAKAGLAAEGTRELLLDLEKAKIGMLAAKGCGAMGADVVLVLHEQDRRTAIEDWARARRLIVCGADTQLVSGFEARA